LQKIWGWKNNFFAGFIFTMVLVAAWPCLASGGDAGNPAHPVHLAVIPFQAVLPERESSNTVICPLCGVGYSAGKIASGAESVVEEIFINKLKEYKNVEIIPLDKVEGAYKRISTESLKRPLLEILIKAGTELHADVIAVGYVFRYMERIGYHYSAEKPASVAFEINFLNPKDGSIIWRGVFDKTQKSLMEDLFQITSFYKGGGKWLNAYELTVQGMDQAFKTFSGFER
jgi:hypothetical protein